MRRKFVNAPPWVDYTYQVATWLSYKMLMLEQFMFDWRFKFLDLHCQCEQCQQRRAK